MTKSPMARSRMLASVRKAALAVVPVLLVASFGIASAAPIDDARDLIDAISATGHAKEAADLEQVVDSMSDSELEAFTTSGIMRMRDALDTYRSVVVSEKVGSGSPAPGGGLRRGTPRLALPSDFPLADFPSSSICAASPDQNPWVNIQGSRSAFFAAQVVWETAYGAARVGADVCDQIVVAIGVGSNAYKGVCIGLNIAKGVAEAILFTAEQAIRLAEFCDDGVDQARAGALYERQSYIHDHLAAHDTEMKAQLDTHDEEVQQLLDEVLARLATIESKVDYLLRSQLEIAMSERGFARPSVYYEERLDELCDLAQASIDELPKVYLVSEKARTLVAEGMSLKATDPKLAADTCIQGYVLATLGSNKLQ